MKNLVVSYHLKKLDRIIYRVDTVSDKIMNTATSIFQVKDLYCKECGIDSREIVDWQYVEEDSYHS